MMVGAVGADCRAKRREVAFNATRLLIWVFVYQIPSASPQPLAYHSIRHKLRPLPETKYQLLLEKALGTQWHLSFAERKAFPHRPPPVQSRSRKAPTHHNKQCFPIHHPKNLHRHPNRHSDASMMVESRRLANKRFWRTWS